ncbi:hypothetical protein JYU34_022666 [Plutella xylostella]|uniref:Uncharacterized protein n=1 Tax=Plutella xylostella TaxID=51655 RepID=A0ABQ7PPN1_PLUXY|nr:hypothetical protein JYU34_022666 [Plutella xylostella]
MEVLVLLPWLFVIITAQDTLYSVDQLLQRGISSGDGVSTYAVDGDDGAIQSNEGLNANLEEQQQKKLQNLGTMFLRMAQAAGLRENKIKRPPYPPTNPVSYLKIKITFSVCKKIILCNIRSSFEGCSKSQKNNQISVNIKKRLYFYTIQNCSWVTPFSLHRFCNNLPTNTAK